jgi:hypothetical protein
MQASLSESRKKQIRTRQAPDDLPFRSSGDPSREQRCGRSVDRSGSSTCEFMESTMSKTAFREDSIYLGYSEWQTVRLPYALSLDQ